MSKIGRPKKFDKQIWYNMLIPEDLKGNLEFYKYMRNCRDNYIAGKNENIDTEILKKMIPEFIEKGIKLETTTEIEDKRIMELIE
ncbi:hypothetical protein ES702_03451 [subsurface metagenome]